MIPERMSPWLRARLNRLSKNREEIAAEIGYPKENERGTHGNRKKLTDE